MEDYKNPFQKRKERELLADQARDLITRIAPYALDNRSKEDASISAMINGGQIKFWQIERLKSLLLNLISLIKKTALPPDTFKKLDIIFDYEKTH